MTNNTFIWGETLDDLFENMSFFYKNNLDGYNANKKRYMDLLAEHARRAPNGKPAIFVEDAIFGITPSR